jgi:hypothetical protein
MSLMFPRPLLVSTLLGCSLNGALAQAPQASSADDLLIPYTVTANDTLIGLNRTLFARPEAWKEVALSNHLTNSNRIAPGQVLMVPARLLHSKQVPATLATVYGDVRIAGKPATVGMLLQVGEAIRTGASSSAVVVLADGSHVKLAPDSEGRLDEQRRFQVKATAAAIDDGLVAASLRLLSGSIEVLASKVLRARPLEVATPTAVIGVRGTSYRVRDGKASLTTAGGADDSSATEVLEGKVHVQVGVSDALQADVPAGFGAPLAAGKAPVVVQLPPAPDLSTVPASFERLPLRFDVPGTTALRVQVADDAAFDHLQVDLVVPAGTPVSIPGLADGAWHLRVRRIGAEGLEGLDAVRDFTLGARPEAPALVEPPSGGKLAVGDVVLRWTKSVDAATYTVDVARDPAFQQLALHADGVHGEQVAFHPTGTAFGAADGIYWWRVVGMDAAGHHGAWTAPQSFVLRPRPRAPMGGVTPDGAAIELTWGGRAEDRTEVELARDADFHDLLLHAEFAAPRGRLPLPASGRYHVHYRFVEPDGFKTPWSQDASLVVENSWRQPWEALMPEAPAK